MWSICSPARLKGSASALWSTWSPSRLKEALLAVRWGEKSLASLYVSVLSGLVVAFQYDPAEPFYSASTMDILVPFGAFWRSLHFFASQLFVLFSLAHFTATLVERWPPAMAFGRWLRLVISLPVIILLLFTGYVLRGDITGDMAGRIAENITLAVPVAGNWLNQLFFSIAGEGLKRVYANHLIGLGILWGALSWEHVKRYKVGWARQGGLLLFLLAFCLFVSAPLDQEKLGVFHISGPWFFLGLQELLRHIPPVWAGVVYPATFVAALALFGAARERVRRWALIYSLLWLGSYLLLSLVGYFRS
ncbi:MAG: cytochrome b N-terminal domain-containing protein [Desulfobacteraceae bacterium]|nr:cytochrome b N-terminal domain-containing protein [Desulfobacteraceae bacterium]